MTSIETGCCFSLWSTRSRSSVRRRTKSLPTVQSAAPQIPWRPIVSMRNRLIHGYFDIDTTIVWKTATVEVPTLLPLLRVLADTTT